MISFLKNNKTGLIIILLGFFTTLFAFYPGFMSNDSKEQFCQAVTHHFNDMQPPIMSFLWAFFNFFWEGPQTMLIFHLLLYWLSFFILYIAYKDKKLYLSLFFLIIPYAPFLLNFAGVIWKDVSFAVSWVLCLSIMLLFYIKKKKIKFWHIAIVFFLLIYGYLSRYNAIITLPFFAAFIIYLYLTINKISTKHKFRFITVSSLLITTICIFLNFIFNSLVEKKYNQQGIMLDDICAVYKNDHKDYFPEYIRNKNSFYKFLNEIKDVEIATIDYGVKKDNIATKKEEFDELQKNWISAIKENPSTYIKYRWKLFLHNFLRIDSVPFYATNFWIIDNDYGIKLSGNEFLFKSYSNYINYIIDKVPFLFKPYFWLLTNIILLILLLTLRKKYEKVIIISLILILLSSLSYIGGYIIWQPCADLRFIYLSIFLITISVGIMLNSYKTQKK